MNLLNLLQRKEKIFQDDIEANEKNLKECITGSNFLVLGGAGSIGQAVTKEIFKRNPNLLHVIDISENNLVELVRDLRSSLGYIKGEFKTFCFDIGSDYFIKFIEQQKINYDYVLNLSALKHVRSEKDPFTLLRMIETNISNTFQTINYLKSPFLKKYFCVSTDKAANPVNMMGASKKIMELFLMSESDEVNISTARFANVAFSDGSLLYGLNMRLMKNQAIAAPRDIKRYFITPQESGELCLLSCILGKNKEIFFPKPIQSLKPVSFIDIIENFLNQYGYESFHCESEQEARQRTSELIPQKKWPCYFHESDTTGEKNIEEFHTEDETINSERFINIGIIINREIHNKEFKKYFLSEINKIKNNDKWSKKEIICLFNEILDDFNHTEKNKFLDERM